MSTDSAFAVSLASTQSLGLVDVSFVGPEHWAPGAQLLRIENTGQQDHHLRLARLRDGASVRAWIQAYDPETVATTIAGMARLGPGEGAYPPLDLAPGTCIAYCLVADVTTRRPHVEMGMMRAIQMR